MKKTFLSIFFVLALCLCLSPMALAEGNSITYIGANGSETETNYTVLTAENISSVTSGTYLISSSSTLTVEGDLSFTGNTTLILGSNATLTVNGVLSCTGNLTITTVENAENAKLIVNGGTREDGNGYGIYAGGSLCIYAGTVEATDADTTADKTNSYGIYVFYNSLTISGSGTSVTATGGKASGSYGESHGIFCQNSNITGGTVETTGNEASGYSYGIEDAGTLSIGGSAQVTAKSNKATGSCGIKCIDMSISGSAEVTAEGNKINKAEGSDGIRCSTVTVDGSAKVTATGGIASQSSCGIRW